MTLKELMQNMRQHYGFEATGRQHVHQLPKWSLRKRGTTTDSVRPGPSPLGGDSHSTTNEDMPIDSSKDSQPTSDASSEVSMPMEISADSLSVPPKPPGPRHVPPRLGHKRPRSTASFEDHHDTHSPKARKTNTEEPTDVLAAAPSSESSLVDELTMAAQSFCMSALSDELTTCILAKLEAALSVARIVNALSQEALFPSELHRYRLLKEAANYLMGASHHARAFDIYVYLYALAIRHSRSDLKVEYMFACMRSADDPSQFQQVAEMIRKDLGFHTSLCHMVMVHMTYANIFAGDELLDPVLRDPSRLSAVRAKQEAPIDESVCLDTAKLFSYSYLIRGQQEPSWKGFVDFVSKTNGTLPGGSAWVLLEDLVTGMRSGLAWCQMALQSDRAVSTLESCAAALSESQELAYGSTTKEHRLACIFVYLFESLVGAGGLHAASRDFSLWINTAHRMGFGSMAFISMLCEMMMSRQPACAGPNSDDDNPASYYAAQAAALAALSDQSLADRFVGAFVRRENRSHALEAFLPAPTPDVAHRLHLLQSQLGLLGGRSSRPCVVGPPPTTPPPRQDFDDASPAVASTLAPAAFDTSSSSSLRRLAGRAGLLMHKPPPSRAPDATPDGGAAARASLAAVSDLSNRLRDTLSLGGPLPSLSAPGPHLPQPTGPIPVPGAERRLLAPAPPGLDMLGLGRGDRESRGRGLGRSAPVVGGLFPSAMPAAPQPEALLGADLLGR